MEAEKLLERWDWREIRMSKRREREERGGRRERHQMIRSESDRGERDPA